MYHDRRIDRMPAAQGVLRVKSAPVEIDMASISGFPKTARAEDAGAKDEPDKAHSTRPFHPAWAAFVRYCQELRHGEIECLKIQDGVPVLAEVTKKKVKF